MDGPVISVIVVQWNVRELLRECLDSLLRETAGLDMEVIVFDNGSTDGSADMVERDFPGVVSIRHDENLGFAKGNNRAAKYAKGKYLLLLNSDTTMKPRTVSRMAEFMEGHPEAAGCAPALREPGGRLQNAAFGYSLGLGTIFNYFFFLSSLFPRVFKGVWQNQEAFVRAGVPVKADWLFGTCLMFRRDVFEAAGGFDEGYHLYSDDIEIGDRLPGYGDLYFLPDVEVVHWLGATNSPRQVKWLTSLFRYIRSKHGPAYVASCRAVAAAGFLMRGLAYKAAGLFKKRYDEHAGKMFGYCVHCLKPFPLDAGAGGRAAEKRAA